MNIIRHAGDQNTIQSARFIDSGQHDPMFPLDRLKASQQSPACAAALHAHRFIDHLPVQEKSNMRIFFKIRINPDIITEPSVKALHKIILQRLP